MQFSPSLFYCSELYVTVSQISQLFDEIGVLASTKLTLVEYKATSSGNSVTLDTQLENYTNYFDFHFLNMRVKDVSDSDKERDIASQQANHQTANNNKSQFVDYFIDKMVFDINENETNTLAIKTARLKLTTVLQTKLKL